MGTRAPKPGRARLGKGAGPVDDLAPRKTRAQRSAAQLGPAPRVRRPACAARSLLPHAAEPGDTDPSPRKAHGAACRPTSEQTRGAQHLSRGGRSQPARLPALPSSTSQPPSPGASALRAGRGGAGPGAGRGGGRRRPKRRSCLAEGPELCAVPTAPLRQPAGTRTPRSPSSSPGLTRPCAMEFLWAPLLGLCCSLAAADRHTVFWNSSNPK